MLFLAALLIATTAAALASRRRRDRRTTARIGLGIALAAAGASHFVTPTPFEQHLPEWVPEPGLVVVFSGIAEIALGIALLAAWPSRIGIGRIVATFFVAVFPTNVYVAVAGIDVDGQPGGLYPWVRLPFQLVFIAWALWSTLPARTDDQPATHGVVPPLPWRTGPAAHTITDAETVVMASVLELRRLRDVPRFLVAALRLRRLFATSSGAIRLSLTATPLRTTFWTLSQWEDQASADAYTRHPEHVDVMRAFAPRMRGSTFATWTEPGSPGPTWARAHAEIASVRPTPEPEQPARSERRSRRVGSPHE
ncbi:MAG: hypothetical protein AAFP84_02575 [Actinomycetota bacterium]